MGAIEDMRQIVFRVTDERDAARAEVHSPLWQAGSGRRKAARRKLMPIWQESKGKRTRKLAPHLL